MNALTKMWNSIKNIFKDKIDYVEMSTFFTAQHTKGFSWKADCGGKEDFDGGLIALSCRYYPDNTAYCGLLMYTDGSVEGSYVTLARAEFSADTATKTRMLAEDWAQQQIAKLYASAMETFEAHADASERRTIDEGHAAHHARLDS